MEWCVNTHYYSKISSFLQYRMLQYNSVGGIGQLVKIDGVQMFDATDLIAQICINVNDAPGC